MSYFATRDGVRVEPPLQAAADLASRRGWSVEEFGERYALLVADGLWRRYDLAVSWIEAEEALQVVCGFELRPPAHRMNAVHATLRRRNDDLLFGAFSLDEATGTVIFRYALPVVSTVGDVDAALDRIVDLALRNCDRLYPAVRLATSADRDPDEAIAAAVIQTVGNA